MLRIGVIAEGVTDQQILEDILIGYFDDEDAFDYVRLQPVLDTTDTAKQGVQGGWGHVVKYCESHEKLELALTDIDYLLIQLDSDICDKLGLDRSGSESTEQIVLKLKNHIITLISSDLYEEFKHKIIFAISVEMIECWLLPIYLTDKKKREKTVGCIKTLNDSLRGKFPFYIDEKNKNYNHYLKLSEPLTKRKNLSKYSPFNPSFALFYAELESKIIIV